MKLKSFLYLLSLCLLIAPGSAFAQSITGALVGTVTDSSGAVVANAKITVRNVDTNQIVGFITNKDGEYSVPNLVPSHYEITISVSGFATYKVADVNLLTNTTLRNDAKLQPGSTEKSIEVTSTPDVLTTDSSTIGAVIEGTQVDRLPLNGRTIDRVLLFTSGNTSDNASAPNISGGLRWGGTYFTVDGVPFNDLGNGAAAYSYDSNLSTLPSTEVVQELKVESNLAPAEFEGGSAIAIVTKSGTNHFHGEAYEFNRNRAYAAKDYFATVGPKPELNRNEFGGTLGGPIWKDKTFFFGSAEYFIYRAGHARSFAVPTDAERQGDFSALPFALNNPATGLPFDNNQITDIDPRAAALLAFVPHANLPTSGEGAINLTQYYPTKYDVQRYTFKIDHNLTRVHTLTLSGTSAVGDPYFSPNGTPSEYGNYENAGYITQSALLRDSMVISPHVLNDIHYSYMTHRSIRLGQNADFDPSTLFPTLYGPFKIGGLPTVNFQNGYTAIGDVGGSGHSPETTQQILDNFTWLRGKHAIKVGAAVDFNAIAIKSGSSNANALGSFGFTGRYTGDSFADFLLGDANTTARAAQQIPVYLKYQNYAFFGQDDWNVTKRLVLNVGLRYVLQTTPTEANGNFTNFDFTNGKFVIRSVHGVLPKDVNQTTLALYPGVYTTSEADGWGSSVMTTDKKDLGPRFGFAYRPLKSDTMVIRGGYGIYYNFIPNFIGPRELSQLNFPFTLNQTYTATSSTTPSITLANPFPGTGSVTANPSIYAVSREAKNTRIQQWNLTVEQLLPGAIGFRLSYVGNKATQAPWYVYNENLPTPMRPLTSLQEGLPYQPWSSILTLVTKGFSITHQLQVEATKRTGMGLYFQTSYTWNRSLDDVPIVGGPQDPSNPAGDKGNSDGAMRHNFFLQGTYDLQIHRQGFGSAQLMAGQSAL
jgi:hypothetical protein